MRLAADVKVEDHLIDAGRFDEEIAPVIFRPAKGDSITFKTDEYPRRGTTPDKLALLKPAFRNDGTVTAGNASGINDGAAALVVAGCRDAGGVGGKRRLDDDEIEAGCRR